jgi:hypothetical protein
MRQRQFTQYYLTQAVLGGRGIRGIGPVYSAPPFLKKGHGIGNILWSLFQAFRPHMWQAAKTVGVESLKILGREALRAGTNIVHDIAQNPQTDPTDIVGKHASESTQNIVRKLWGGVRPRAKKRVVHKLNGASRPRANNKNMVANKRKAPSAKRGTKRPKTIKLELFS